MSYKKPMRFNELMCETLKGKDILVKTDVGEVMVTIEKLEVTKNHFDTSPATPENDWWPNSETTTNYEFTFTNGYKKTYQYINDILFFV